MHNVTVLNQPPAGIPAKSMKIGQFGKIVSFNEYKEHVGQILVKAYGDCYILEDPQSTWTAPNCQVEVLLPGTKIEITIGE